jgi:hypothetical protein
MWAHKLAHPAWFFGLVEEKKPAPEKAGILPLVRICAIFCDKNEKPLDKSRGCRMASLADWDMRSGRNNRK